MKDFKKKYDNLKFENFTIFDKVIEKILTKYQSLFDFAYSFTIKKKLKIIKICILNRTGMSQEEEL